MFASYAGISQEHTVAQQLRQDVVPLESVFVSPSQSIIGGEFRFANGFLGNHIKPQFGTAINLEKTAIDFYTGFGAELPITKQVYVGYGGAIGVHIPLRIRQNKVDFRISGSMDREDTSELVDLVGMYNPDLATQLQGELQRTPNISVDELVTLHLFPQYTFNTIQSQGHGYVEIGLKQDDNRFALQFRKNTRPTSETVVLDHELRAQSNTQPTSLLSVVWRRNFLSPL